MATLIKWFLALGLGLSCGYAEYRVYQYSVRSRLPNPLEKNAFLVTSSLDPVSYIAYHGGYQAIKIDLLRTWICKGHTAKQRPCPPPLARLNFASPSISTEQAP